VHRELRQELLLYTSDDYKENKDNKGEQLLSCDVPLCFDALFTMHQKIVRPLKLHAHILNSVIHTDPWSSSSVTNSPLEQQGGNNNDLESTATTSLDRYMGDVFALTFLMSFSDLGIVEGGPTNAACVRQLRMQKKKKLQQQQPLSPKFEASQCYRSWVYMHSSVLRVKTFTKEQQQRLDIPAELCEISEMIPHDYYLSDVFMKSEMRLKILDFGRLGPAHFRGRDVPRIRDLPARGLFAFFVTDNVNHNGETTRTAIEWLCLVHDQAKKVRPMTVSPPTVRLCRPDPH